MRQTTLCGCKSGKPIIGKKQAIYINMTKKGGLLRPLSIPKLGKFNCVLVEVSAWVAAQCSCVGYVIGNPDDDSLPFELVYQCPCVCFVPLWRTDGDNAKQVYPIGCKSTICHLRQGCKFRLQIVKVDCRVVVLKYVEVK